MSNAISQSATKLAVSTQGEDSYDFNARIKLIADRTAKGATRERQMLKWNKLFAGLCNDYKAHFPALYGRTDLLPSDITSKIENAISTFIQRTVGNINPANIISYRRGFFHNSREAEVVERLVITGENKLVLKEQLFGVTTFITAAEKRLKDLEAKPTPDFEREKAVKASIMKLNLTKEFILGEMARQEALAKATAEAEAKENEPK